MTHHINRDTITNFILNPRLKIYRHLLLQLIFIAISIEVFFSSPDGVEVSMEITYGWFSYYLLLNILIYTNIYVLTPRFLINNKPFLYLISVLLLIVASVAFTGVLKIFFYDAGVIYQEPDSTTVLLSFIATLLSIGLLVIGTSAFLLFKHWIRNTERINELESATLESELKFLKSQINPHFLFNMLNNANIMVDENPDVASQILVKLDDMLRYQIKDSAQDKVHLNADILFLTDFLDLEKTRRDYFDYTIIREGDISNIEISPLLFIPFVENAVKHNLDSENLSFVHISFKVRNDRLTFACENSKPKRPAKKKDGGLGLANIKRRLDLLYGENYSLDIKETETTYTVNLDLKI